MLRMGALSSFPAFFRQHRRRMRNVLLGALAVLILLAVLYSYLFGPSAEYAQAESFIIEPGTPTAEAARSLKEELFWDEEKKQEWEHAPTMDADLTEGVYYPDTYLIPGDQSPASIAARLPGRFADVFAPYAEEAREKGMDWNTVLTLASLVDKEAGPNDKELVAGILWNRVERDMLLQVDATLQYIRGSEEDWWPVPKSSDKYLDSPLNTYKYSGLPPHPINNPREESVKAVLNPTPTNCLFYIHADQEIYCSVTYAGQEANVDRYLR